MIRKTISRIYRLLISIEIRIRNFLFGFENVNHRLQTLPQDSICAVLSLYGATIGNNVVIESPIFVNAKRNFGNLSIGNNTYIGKACFIDIKGKVEIGENSVISMQSTLISHIDLGAHNRLAKIFPPRHDGCRLAANCYVGARSTILMGVTLNEGSFVAAGSVVVHDVSPHTMVAGVPAKPVKDIGI